MLTYDPDERINAKGCLNHLFFRDIIREENSKEAHLRPVDDGIAKQNVAELNDKSVNKQTEVKLQQEPQNINPAVKVAKIPDTETHPKAIKIEKYQDASLSVNNNTTTLPHIEEKNSKMQLSSIGISTKATIFGNEFKNIKYSIHPDGVIDVAATTTKKNYQSTTLPKLQPSNSIVSSQKGNPRPSYEAAPLSTMSSNYHIIRKTDTDKSTFYKPRYTEDGKTLDVALARARRAVKRQNEINSGKIKGRLAQKGHMGLNVIGNQKVILYYNI